MPFVSVKLAGTGKRNRKGALGRGLCKAGAGKDQEIRVVTFMAAKCRHFNLEKRRAKTNNFKFEMRED